MRQLDFPQTVFGVGRPVAGGSVMPEAMRRYANWFGDHCGDAIVE